MKVNEIKQESKESRQYKFLMAIPIIIYPFLTLLLWSVGILGSSSTAVAQSDTKKGLNMDLPEAKLKEDKAWNKLSFYAAADKDSARWKDQLKSDPYFKKQSNILDSGLIMGHEKENGSRFSNDPAPKNKSVADENATKVYRKIEQLNKELANSTTSSQINGSKQQESISLTSPSAISKPEVDRLESMMLAMKSEKEDDPEITQLNGMLERILDIQHPERIEEKLRENSANHKGQVFPVQTQQENNVTLLAPRFVGNNNDTIHNTDSIIYTVRTAIQRSRFYSLEDGERADNAVLNAIEAVVHETQTIVSGATLKLRLTNDVFINGVHIPAGHFVYGIVSLNGERLLVNIKTIGYNNTIFPVALSVYDMDGMEGMYMPGTITRDVMKQSTDRTIQSLGLSSLDPSIGAQAAGAGIEAAKNLLSKKVKLVKVTVKAGYSVLLRDGNSK
ncbi:conjugative transposon protein TraM [Filimonas effusa]|uniref:Conjugative transposon protein TraM n=1 Tax=Filimonas effusa TaxID=2508721 RepID=A0A4Q1DBX1_9BACT|nr:conjugative transposon protein TraM [Filimonas effusa]RXK86984.1 conjugative transposon protein TraM [Filimonas effusa]